ncbi:MAG TPA: hypothetical protein PKX92_01755 [Edaphocola sp.]|nr:hypothetical protein [Edaphocola sp.]
MVNIIENKCIIEGQVISIQSNEKLKGYWQVKILLKKSISVEGTPNLGKLDEGKEILINIPRSISENLKLNVGGVFKGLAKKSTPFEYFIIKQSKP